MYLILWDLCWMKYLNFFLFRSKLFLQILTVYVFYTLRSMLDERSKLLSFQIWTSSSDLDCICILYLEIYVGWKIEASFFSDLNFFFRSKLYMYFILCYLRWMKDLNFFFSDLSCICILYLQINPGWKI